MPSSPPKMQLLPVLCLFGVLIPLSGCVVYKPCDLAVAIKDLYFLPDNSQIPLIVCIAGYRNFNSSYRLENPKNNTGYYGIFGLHNADVNNTNCAAPTGTLDVKTLTDGDLLTNLRCLQTVILNNPLNLEFYKGMCSPSMVHGVPCPITNYVQTDVFDPVDKRLFEKAFAKGGLPIPPPLPPTDTPSSCCCGNNNTNYYWALYITVPAILIALVFFAVKAALKRRAELQASRLIDT